MGPRSFGRHVIPVQVYLEKFQVLCIAYTECHHPCDGSFITSRSADNEVIRNNISVIHEAEKTWGCAPRALPHLQYSQQTGAPAMNILRPLMMRMTNRPPKELSHPQGCVIWGNTPSSCPNGRTRTTRERGGKLFQLKLTRTMDAPSVLGQPNPVELKHSRRFVPGHLDPMPQPRREDYAHV